MLEVFSWQRIQKLHGLPYVIQYRKLVYVIDLAVEISRNWAGA